MQNKSESSWLDYHDKTKDNDRGFSWLTRYDLKPTAEPIVTWSDIVVGTVDLLILILFFKNL